uniref:Uncharacterized protein n=1 Tax=Sphaerodactylus townsendi TaxID=933632 RepID=A0ACB8FJW1_9SAUR
MSSGIQPAKGYLDLLHSDTDPLILFKSIEEDHPSDHAPDATLDDQDNNPDVFYTVESNDSGEEVCLRSSTREAYEKIAKLVEYVLEEEPAEDLFAGSLDSDDATSEGCSEPKKQCLCSGSSSLAASPMDTSPAEAVSLSSVHVQFSLTTIAPAGRLPKMFRPPDPVFDTMILTFLPPSPVVNLPLGPAVLDINICPAEDAIYKAPQIRPLPSEKAFKRPDIVDTFSMRLKTSFGERCRFVPSEQDAPVDSLYVECDMVRRHIENRSGRNADLRICDLEEKEMTTVESLFQMLEKHELGSNKVFLVLGKAGMGKSLLAQKICLDWSHGKFAQFKFVFQFDCRQLSLLHGKHYSLRQLLFEFSVGSQNRADNDVYRYLLRNPDEVLLIFDGFEELQDLEGSSPCLDSLPRKEPRGTSAILAGLFQKKVLNGCVMLLTSRPKEKLHQYLPRVDKCMELMGFSLPQAEAYLARYFEGSSYCRDAANLIKSSPYLFSYCYNPDLCRIVCFVCKSALESGGGEVPSSLTGLLVRFFLQKLGPSTNEATSPEHQNISTLAQVAWSLGQDPHNVLTNLSFPSVRAKEAALKCGILVPLASSNGREGCGYVFSSSVVHNFLVALHLVLAQEIKDKRLTKHLWVVSKAKKFPYSWDLVPRFLTGLLFLRGDLSSSFFREEGEMDIEKMISKKRRSLFKYIRKLEIVNLSPDRLMEVVHCIHETEEPSLLQHLALRVRPALSFLGFPFAPPDVHILLSVLRKSTKEFALDLRGSSVSAEGLRNLVCLRNVTSYRASLGEAVQLWEHLWETTGGEQLRSAMEKFTINPFKAQTVKDVHNLSALMHMQEKMSHRLGPTCGLEGFKKLVEILGAFPALQHLDLDSQKENEIGDEGVAALSDILPRLCSLETLNLSQNKITNVGVEKLAGALPSLPSLKTLSVYNNSIGDAGAENFAKALPELASLRELNIQFNKITAAGAQSLTDSLRKCPHMQSMALWNPTIPHGVLEHLQQLDSRIRSL